MRDSSSSQPGETYAVNNGCSEKTICNSDGEYRYVEEDQIESYEAEGWVCLGTMPGHHAERGWMIWKRD